MTWLRLWPAIPVLLLGIWAARLDQLRSRYQLALIECQSGRQVDRANADRDAAKTETGWVRQQQDADKARLDREASREPIIIHSRDTVREYATTPAGRAGCLPADRVRELTDTRAALFAEAASAPGGSAAPLPPGGAGDAAGRLHDER